MLRSLLSGALAAWLLCGAPGAAAGTTAAAQPSGSVQARELANLKDDVQLLKTQQQQILDSLDELKKLLKTHQGA
jgi:hypothetical protein